MPNDIKDKLLKLKNLRDGVGATDGERSNADAMLKKLLKKYDLKEEDLEDNEPIDIYWFKVKSSIGKFGDNLLGQLVNKVREGSGLAPVTSIWGSRHRRGQKGYDLTERQAEVVRERYKTLAAKLEHELEMTYRAFVQMADLGLEGNDEERHLTPEEEDELTEMWKRASVIGEITTPEVRRERLLDGK